MRLVPLRISFFDSSSKSAFTSEVEGPAQFNQKLLRAVGGL